MIGVIHVCYVAWIYAHPSGIQSRQDTDMQRKEAKNTFLTPFMVFLDVLFFLYIYKKIFNNTSTHDASITTTYILIYSTITVYFDTAVRGLQYIHIRVCSFNHLVFGCQLLVQYACAAIRSESLTKLTWVTNEN